MSTDETRSKSAGELPGLTEESRQYLLKVARKAIVGYVTGNKPETLEYDDPALTRKWGAFVTLKIKKHLRGCIGALESQNPLPETIADMAVKSAINDPRFSPISPKELDHLDIDISVLGELVKVENIEEIEIGRDGLVIEYSGRHGLLLPQVATEHKLDRESFLNHTCLKAGIPDDSWKKGAKIFRFPAEVF